MATDFSGSVISFSLSFVDIFLFAKRKGAIFILANFDCRMCCTFVPKVIIWGSPLLGLSLWGKSGRSVVLLAHVACFAHTAVLFFCCCIFTTPDIPLYRNSFPEVSALYCIILFVWFFFLIKYDKSIIISLKRCISVNDCRDFQLCISQPEGWGFGKLFSSYYGIFPHQWAIKEKRLFFFFLSLIWFSVFYAKNKTKNTESDCHFYIAVPKIEVTYSYTSNIRVIWFNFYLLFIAFFNWKKSQFWNLSSQQIFICSFSWFIVVLPDSDLLCVLKMIRSL